MKEFWNERFAADEYIYGETPNEFYRSQLNGLTPGKLLLPGEGEGRNAVWAASLGWKVDAIDYSESAKQKALSLAAKYGVELEKYLIQDLTDLDLLPASYDAIALIFIHLEPNLRSKVHQQIIDALKPNGVLIMEAFHPGQLQLESGGPKNPEMLYTAEMLKNDFGKLTIVSLEESVGFLQEGNYHKGEAAVVRLVATKAN